MSAPLRIDVHHHFIPPVLERAFAARGLTKVAGAPLPKWSPERSLSVMDATGIETALFSLSAPGVHFGDDDAAASLARAGNEFAAQLTRERPDRFGSFAVLPMRDAERAAREAVYVLDVLKADGVILFGSTRRAFLGDPSLDELMAELDKRAAVVFVHPNIRATGDQLSLTAPQFFVEFLCDTTRAAANLIFNGAIERYPNIKFILAHAGGFVPYIAWRLSLGNLLPDIAAKTLAGVLEYAKRFCHDSALPPSPFAMAALTRLVDPSHILFGSDFPFAPAPLTATQTKALDELPEWDAAMRGRVARGNALALFPRFARPGETPVSPLAPGRSVGLRAGLKSVAPRTVVGLVDRLRNR